MHCHFRRGDLLKEVVPWTAQYARYGIAMPNTRPQAILNVDDVINYRREIASAAALTRENFDPLMTIEIRESTTPEMLEDAFYDGAVAGKIYPAGVTTNSDEGVRNFQNPQLKAVFKKMEELKMLLLFHGEINDIETRSVLHRYKPALEIIDAIAHEFPRLKIVLEHISTAEEVNWILETEHDNVAATITGHHLILTLNDVIGDGMKPHNACMPMPKFHKDRERLRFAATSGNPKFFLGSDSAPHVRMMKESAKGANGVYTAPVLPSVLLKVFEELGCLDRLEDFTSTFAAKFYDLPLCNEKILFIKMSWTVPPVYGSIVPFMAGERLDWQLAP